MKAKELPEAVESEVSVGRVGARAEAGVLPCCAGFQIVPLFSTARGQVQIVGDPGVEERHKLFTRLFMKRAIMLKKRKNKNGT